MLSAKEVAALAAKALDAKIGEDISLIGITDISTLPVKRPRRGMPSAILSETRRAVRAGRINRTSLTPEPLS